MRKLKSDKAEWDFRCEKHVARAHDFRSDWQTIGFNRRNLEQRRHSRYYGGMYF